MTNFKPFTRDQVFLLPPSLSDWVPEDDLSHFIIAAVDRVSLSEFRINARRSGRAQYHPRMMLCLLIYGYANGIFSSLRLERATYRDIGVRYIAANQHPDHDTIAHFRKENRTAFEAAFLQVLLMAREAGLLNLGNVAIDGTKIDANASKTKSVRYDRALALREQLAADIKTLTGQAEAADAQNAPGPQALPEEISRLETMKQKLDEACVRLEEEAKAGYETAKAEYDGKKAAWDAKKGRRGKEPVPPGGEAPGPDQQISLTGPDSRVMRKSHRHEYRQSCNPQAIVDADKTMLVPADCLQQLQRHADFHLTN